MNLPEPSKIITGVFKSNTSSKEPEKQVLKEMDDWEDAAELSTPMNQVAILVIEFSGDRKYSSDFFLTIMDQCKDLPNHFEIFLDIVELLGNSQALASNVGEAYALASTTRGLDRKLSGNYLLERRGEIWIVWMMIDGPSQWIILLMAVICGWMKILVVPLLCFNLAKVIMLAFQEIPVQHK